MTPIAATDASVSIAIPIVVTTHTLDKHGNQCLELGQRGLNYSINIVVMTYQTYAYYASAAYTNTSLIQTQLGL